MWMIQMKMSFHCVNWNMHSTRTAPSRTVGSPLINHSPACLVNAVLCKNMWLKAVLPPLEVFKIPNCMRYRRLYIAWCPPLLGFRELRADQEAKSALHNFPSLSLGTLVQNRNWSHQLPLSSEGDHGVTVQVHGLLSSQEVFYFSLAPQFPRTVQCADYGVSCVNGQYYYYYCVFICYHFFSYKIL